MAGSVVFGEGNLVYIVQSDLVFFGLRVDFRAQKKKQVVHLPHVVLQVRVANCGEPEIVPDLKPVEIRFLVIHDIAIVHHSQHEVLIPGSWLEEKRLKFGVVRIERVSNDRREHRVVVRLALRNS